MARLQHFRGQEFVRWPKGADSTRRVIPGYELLRPIGRGGMGEATLARQLSLGRLVVVKFLNRDCARSPLDQEVRFRREAELMARVSHPNIATIFDYGFEEGRPFLVMEYVEGGDLRSHLVPGKRLEVERVRQLLRPLVQALGCLHQHGILHLDLKPENILMAGGGTPKVSDFGIALPGGAIDTPAETDHFVGTVGYAAPEQQYRLPVDERSDQYSLAALCYELLTGQLPLGAFPLPSHENRRLHPSVDPVFKRALSEDRSDRYPTISEFGEALDQALALPGRRSHRPWLIAAAALLAVCSVVAARAGKMRPLPRPAPVPAPPPPTVKAKESIAALSQPPPIRAPRHEGQEASAPIPDRPRAVPPPVSKPSDDLSRLLTVEVDALRMVLVLIPEGSFLMGSPDSAPYGRPDEKQAHRVRFDKAFYLGACEVTVRQFRAFVDATRYVTSAEKDGKGGAVFDKKRQEFVRKPDINWRNPGFRRTQADDEPVVQLSWDDASEFCKWLSDREGVHYRLPTEAEWEYACRAGSQSVWFFGDDSNLLCDYAWFKLNAGSTTHPVARRRANAFGLHDVYGNVGEWCKDRYAPGYPEGEDVDPKGPAEGHGRVLRGGSWGSLDPLQIRSANRRGESAGYRSYSVGFPVRRSIVSKVASPRSP